MGGKGHIEYNEVGIPELVTLTNLGPIIKEKLIFYKISNEKKNKNYEKREHGINIQIMKII